MQPHLKDDRTEWQKFALVWSCAASLTLIWFRLRRGLPAIAFIGCEMVALAALVSSLFVPRIFRTPYRLVSILSRHVGQVVASIILMLVFVLWLTPLALLLRALGKDLLDLRTSAEAGSYWQPARPSDHFERQF
jgi:hypothetical protein